MLLVNNSSWHTMTNLWSSLIWISHGPIITSQHGGHGSGHAFNSLAHALVPWPSSVCSRRSPPKYLAVILRCDTQLHRSQNENGNIWLIFIIDNGWYYKGYYKGCDTNNSGWCYKGYSKPLSMINHCWCLFQWFPLDLPTRFSWKSCSCFCYKWSDQTTARRKTWRHIWYSLLSHMLCLCALIKERAWHGSVRSIGTPSIASITKNDHHSYGRHTRAPQKMII